MIQSRTSRKITKYKIIYCKISSIYNIYTWFIMILDFVWPGNPIGTSENPKKNNREIPGVLNPTFSSHATACAKQQPEGAPLTPKGGKTKTSMPHSAAPRVLELGKLAGYMGFVGELANSEIQNGMIYMYIYIYTHNIIQIYIYTI